MEWSLVLASQGIEPVIEEVEGDWYLAVAEGEIDRSADALRLYEAENRRWPWQQSVWHGTVLFDWASLAWGILLVIFYRMQVGSGLAGPGRMDNEQVRHGEWWRLFTATWLHADVGHLAANLSAGVFLLALVMGRFGTGVGALSAVLAGAGGNLLAVLVTSGPRRSLGASGVVLGCLGLLAVPSWEWVREGGRRWSSFMPGLMAAVLLFVLVGVAPGSDVVAHAGGFLSGVLLGALLGRLRRPSQNARLNFGCGLILAAVVVVPWWRALGAGR